jgi:hypothetical protein
MGHSWPCFLVFVQLLIGVIKHCWATITPEMKYAIGALFASHGVSYVHNYLIRGEYAVAGAKQLMEAPYSRVMVMHFAIIAGAFLSAMIGSPAGILVILIVMKTIIDVKFHLRQHKIALNARLHDNEKFTLSRVLYFKLNKQCSFRPALHTSRKGRDVPCRSRHWTSNSSISGISDIRFSGQQR